MSGIKGAHHRGTYHVDSAKVRAAANRNPATVCWRDGLTLAQHPPGAFWTAGHVNDGETGGLLLPEASCCNFSRGAAAGNAQRTKPGPRRTSRTW